MIEKSTHGLSVVIPMYNEEENAERSVLTVLDFVKTHFNRFEIVVVESGSTDGTLQIINQLAKTIPQIKVFHQEKKEGLGSAIRLGFKKATLDYVMYIDGDEPFDLKLLTRVIPYLGNSPVIIGYRLGARENFKRKLYSWTYNRLVRTVLGVKVRDVNFSMKVIRRALLDNLRLQSNGCFYDAELLSEIVKQHVPIVEIGFEYTPRKGGQSTLDRPSVILKILQEMASYWWKSSRKKKPVEQTSKAPS